MSFSRKLLALPLMTGALLAAGVAFAAWTSDGTGSLTAQSTTSEDSVIAAGTYAADLYPGAAKSVTVTISNPNDYPVLVTSLAAGSSGVVNTTCVAGTVTGDARALDATGLVQSDGTTKTVAANGSGTYTVTTRMAASAADACKSQTFTLALTATIVSTV